MTQESKLKPCPFCGGEALRRYPQRVCKNCGAHSWDAGSQEEADEVWNRRPTEQAQTAKIEHLLAENERLRGVLEDMQYATMSVPAELSPETHYRSQLLDWERAARQALNEGGE